ncbi:protein bag-of-marbles [Drosophila eugracilis]|uniref:protein bag-of-marbles n=1 Tax=Drosophila eugracilis TaxID=29029 RepID=UPI0007E5DBED|nr:protein bag-of-marbles [Drosophila eugracilis]
MFNSRAMGYSAYDDQQLCQNLRELQYELSSMMESNEASVQHRAPSNDDQSDDGSSSSPEALLEIQQKLRVMRLDKSAPQFEFHGLGCMHQLQKRSSQFGLGSVPAKKSRTARPPYLLVTGPKQEQLQKENVWNQRQREEEASAPPITIEKLRSIGLYGDCVERNAVLRLMNLFRSLHDHLSADLGFSRQNSMPSDYLFEMPVKNTMPRSLNVRYQLQVLCSKVERFLEQQRRTLENNRNFDYEKYTECDKLIKGSASYLQSFNQFKNIEMRHRNGNFVNNTENVQRLEGLLAGLREWLKATHLCVHVFNWEMDLEHRYSAAMTESHRSLNERAILLASSELKAAKPRAITTEEVFIAKKYKLDNAVSCAIEQDDFLNALLANPEIYFPPEVVAICGPPKIADLNAEDDSEFMDEYEVVDEAPSSPQRRNERVFVRFRS